MRRRSPAAEDTPEKRRLAELEFRVNQEREQFQIYEQRRVAVELEATAITAAALTVAGLLILGQKDLSRLGDGPQWGDPARVGRTALDHGRCDHRAVRSLDDAEMARRAEEAARRRGAA
jgi:hypothetical protein